MVMEMIQSEPPYINDSQFKAMQKIMKQGRPKLKKEVKISKELDKFLDLCLAKRAEKRASADTLLSHPFIVGNAYSSVEKLIPLIQRLTQQMYA